MTLTLCRISLMHLVSPRSRQFSKFYGIKKKISRNSIPVPVVSWSWCNLVPGTLCVDQFNIITKGTSRAPT